MTITVDPTSYIEDDPFLTNFYGDEYLYSVNRQVFNTNGADAVYRDYLPIIFWNKNRLFVVVVTYSGLFIEQVTRHSVPTGSCYLFVKLDGIIDQITQRFNIS